MRKSPKNLPEEVPLWVLPLGGIIIPPSNASVAPPRKGCHPMQLNFPEDAADSLPPQPIPLGQKAGGSKGAEVKAERFYFHPLRRRSRNQEVPGESLVTFFSGNLSSQVQQQIGKDFRGGVPVEAFARTMIQLFCKLGQSLCRKRNLIGVFGNVLPQQAVDLLV